MPICSPKIQFIFDDISAKTDDCYEIAKRAKPMGYDPDTYVKIPLAKNMAERVEGLISTVAPQILGKGVPQRIQQLEEKYGSQDWRIGMVIAEEVAKGKFCEFKDKKEAIEIGIRVGFSYVTVGVVSSPLEGFIGIDFRQREDGKGEYIALIYGGPIRSAGGTAASVSVLIADYVRKKLGYQEYDSTERERKRAFAELCDYHDRVTNLQYFPSEEEVEFLVSHLPLQIDGDPSEKYDVSNFKDLARRQSNRISNGFCLVTAECLSLKAPKVSKRLKKWGDEMGMEHWKWLADFVILQKEMKAKGAKEGKDEDANAPKVKPDATFIKDIVAGRPVFTYPLRTGGFRLRYGRGRVSGFSADSVHPATMVAVDNFLAVGTQLKTERPGKSTTLNVCDQVEGPIVRLKSGEVLQLTTFEQAKSLQSKIDHIIYLGDILINWGDFNDRGHKLLPPGFVEEWWVYYAKEVFDKVSMDKEYLDKLFKFPLITKVTLDQAVQFSELDVPMYPKYILYWKALELDEFRQLYTILKDSVREKNKIVIPHFAAKLLLEKIGCPHKVQGEEYILIEGETVKVLNLNLGDFQKEPQGDSVLEMVNSLSKYNIKDKCGYAIGARMGRPEKAKMRKMQGSPHTLFPVGEEGGRMKSLTAAVELGKVRSNFPAYDCPDCKKEGIYYICQDCGAKTKRKWWYRDPRAYSYEEENEKYGKGKSAKFREIDVKHVFYKGLEQIGNRQYPPLIKGLKGMSSVEQLPEHIVKGIVRAKHRIHVNKDGTVRYDMTELPLTHFKPKEIRTSVERLKELGYTHDIYGNELVNDNQVLEIFCQDVILPSCPVSMEEGADAILFRVANFLDEMLKVLYKDKPYYNLKTKEDLVGHLICAMSPHTSAGIICRIIGFSKAQGMYAHPLLHSIMRRDCLGYDSYLPLFDGEKWTVRKIGDVVSELDPSLEIDLFGTKAKKVEGWKTIGYKNGKPEIVPIKDFTVHAPKEMYHIQTECGREIEVTEEHIFYLKGMESKQAHELDIGDKLKVLYDQETKVKDIKSIDLLGVFSDLDGLMVRNLGNFVQGLVQTLGGRVKVREKLEISKSTLDNFLYRDSYSLNFIKNILGLAGKNLSSLPQGVKIGMLRDSVLFPRFVKFDEDLLYLVGLYVAEGYSRRTDRLNQVDYSATEEEIREDIARINKEKFGLTATWVNEDRLVFSSRLYYEFFVSFLKCGSYAKDKRIPDQILSLPLERLKHFLKGYYDGDGSVSAIDCRVTCDSISEGLLQDLEFVLRRYGIFSKFTKYKKKPGPKVAQFYLDRDGAVPEFENTKLIITSSFYKIFYNKIGFKLQRKQEILSKLVAESKPYGMKIDFDENFVYPKIKSITKLGKKKSYCLNVEEHKIFPNGILTNNCDGDEAGCMLLLDTLLNFSRKFLPNTRGVTQDAPLVLTGELIPSEVDDMVFNMDIVPRYPLEMYEAAEEYKNPWDVKIDMVENHLGKETQYEGYMFTHDTDDINGGVLISAYKTLPTMKDKVRGQMEVARKIRAVEEHDVARLVIERHFLRDIKGCLRKFSQQSFRCVKCNEIYRRPPMHGKCNCTGKLVFTIAEGSVKKYMKPALNLSVAYNLPPYLQQTLLLLNDRIDSVFGKEPETQEGLGKWF